MPAVLWETACVGVCAACRADNVHVHMDITTVVRHTLVGGTHLHCMSDGRLMATPMHTVSAGMALCEKNGHTCAHTRARESAREREGGGIHRAGDTVNSHTHVPFRQLTVMARLRHVFVRHVPLPRMNQFFIPSFLFAVKPDLYHRCCILPGPTFVSNSKSVIWSFPFGIIYGPHFGHPHADGCLPLWNMPDRSESSPCSVTRTRVRGQHQNTRARSI